MVSGVVSLFVGSLYCEIWSVSGFLVDVVLL